MTRGQLRTSLQATGFGNTTAEVVRQNDLLDAAYLWVWNARDPQGVKINWSFERVDQAALAVTASDATPSMPSDFGDADWIADDQGAPLTELEPEAFDAQFAASVAAGQTSGRSWAYKVVNRQVTLGPTPSLAASYTMTYTRRVAHVNGAGVTTGGTLASDADTPLWPDHHLVLVWHAALLGHAANSNPFAAQFQGLRDQALESMRADLEAEFAPAQTWGGGGWASRGW